MLLTAVRCVPAGTLATVQKAPRELTTSRLTLRPPGRGDRSLWVGLHRDPALYEHGVFAMPEAEARDADRQPSSALPRAPPSTGGSCGRAPGSTAYGSPE